MKIVIREADEADAGAIYSLILALAEHEGTGQYVLTNEEMIRDQGFGNSRKFGTLLAWDKDIPVGYITYVWNYSTWQGGHYMYMENIFVLDQYRRAGVGSALLKSAKDVCKENDVVHVKWEVQTENIRAVKFYENFGATVSLRGIGTCKAC